MRQQRPRLQCNSNRADASTKNKNGRISPEQHCWPKQTVVASRNENGRGYNLTTIESLHLRMKMAAALIQQRWSYYDKQSTTKCEEQQ